MSSAASTSTSTSDGFSPTDEELLLQYLKRKFDGVALPNDVIKEVEVYKHDADKLIDRFGSRGQEKSYFFTSTYRATLRKDLPCRTTQGGYWRSKKEDKIRDKSKKLIGYKVVLHFYTSDNPKTKLRGGRVTDWVMHEYKLHKSQSVNCVRDRTDPMKLEKWVLCCIFKRDRRKTSPVRWKADTSSKGETQASDVGSKGAETKQQSRTKSGPEQNQTRKTRTGRSKAKHTSSKEGELAIKQDNEQSMVPPSLDNLPAEPKASDVGLKGVDDLLAEPKALDVGIKGNLVSVPCVNWKGFESSDTSSKEGDNVLQQGPLSGNRADNVQCVDPLLDDVPAEPIPEHLDVGTEGHLMSTSDVMDMLASHDEQMNANEKKKAKDTEKKKA